MESVPTYASLSTSCGLSRRELEVLVLITNGHSNAEIGETLFLGLNTVKTYIRTLYRKLDVETRPHAILWGARHGLMQGVVPVETQLLVA